HSVYYSSIFTPVRVHHNRNMIFLRDMELAGGFLCEFLLFSRQKDLRSVSVEKKDPGDRRAVSSVITASTDAEDVLLTVLSLENSLHLLHRLQCSSLHQHTGRDSHLLDGPSVKFFHFSAGNDSSHMTSPCIKECCPSRSIYMTPGQSSILSCLDLCVVFFILFPLILAEIIGQPHQALGKMYVLHDHIPGSVKIDMGEIPDRLDTVPDQYIRHLP